MNTTNAKTKRKPASSNKRKLANAEEQPGGLLIVRAPPSSAPTTTNPLGSTQPSKKFKSSQPSRSQPIPSTFKPLKSSLPSTLTTTFAPRHDTPDADPALDDAARAFESEAADLRRSSRGPPQTPDASGSQPRRFPAQTQTSYDSETGQGRRRETIIDSSHPLPTEDDESPQIHRNKRLRAGAMVALSSGSGSNMVVDPVTPPRNGVNASSSSSTTSSQRRKSSIGRGKRISSAFQTTGVITQPHNSVADTSFHKHIDPDLPDSYRLSQLLMWCLLRDPSTSPSTSSSTPDSPPPLPKLSKKAEQELKVPLDALVRKLAEGKFDLSPQEEDEVPKGDLAPNTQNKTNRTWEGVYGGHIQNAMEEEEGWKKANYIYDAYSRRVGSAIEKRRAAVGLLDNTAAAGASGSSTSTPSAKAQGKQRARSLEPREQELSPSFQTGLRLARKLYTRSRWRDAKTPGNTDIDTATPGAGPSTQRKGADPDSRPLPAPSQGYDMDIDMDVVHPDKDSEARTLAEEAKQVREAEETVRARMAEIEFKLDHLYVMANQARTTMEVAQVALDQRFEVLASGLEARSSVHRGGEPSSANGNGLGQYVGGARSGRDEKEEAEETLQLLRALARVDAARPPAQVGDAARRAVREVQRVGESSGAGGLEERRLTAVPPVTPRKMPGTPRRGTTPTRPK